MLFQRLSDNDVFGSLHDMRRFQDSLDRLLSQGLPAQSTDFPPVNVWTSDGGAIMRAEIPGIAPEDVEISLIHDTITMKGTRKREELKEGESLHRQERGFGQFTRSLQLPFAVDAEQVEATFSNGVLEIKLPRAEAEKPRKINVVSQP